MWGVDANFLTVIIQMILNEMCLVILEIAKVERLSLAVLSMGHINLNYNWLINN